MPRRGISGVSGTRRPIFCLVTEKSWIGSVLSGRVSDADRDLRGSKLHTNPITTHSGSPCIGVDACSAILENPAACKYAPTSRC